MNYKLHLYGIYRVLSVFCCFLSKTFVKRSRLLAHQHGLAPLLCDTISIVFWNTHIHAISTSIHLSKTRTCMFVTSFCHSPQPSATIHRLSINSFQLDSIDNADNENPSRLLSKNCQGLRFRVWGANNYVIINYFSIHSINIFIYLKNSYFINILMNFLIKIIHSFPSHSRIYCTANIYGNKISSFVVFIYRVYNKK